MGKDSNDQQTDFMPAEEFRKRRREAKQRGDKYVSSSDAILVPFDSNFDKFAANVAYELRGLMTYRSDGGNFARGVVRASGELQLIHRAYVGGADQPTNGTKIRLFALFYRRQDATATNRWMMEIHFNAPDWIWADDDEPIVASEKVTQQSQENAMKAVLHCANLLARDLTGQEGDQIRNMLKIADDVGYRRNWDLWYYNRLALSEYMDYMTVEKRRREMTGKNGLDGYVYPHGEWRIYPFREMVQKFGMQTQGGNCDAAVHGITIKRTLSYHWYEIAESLNFINKQMDKIGPAASYGADLGTGALWHSMLDSLMEAQKMPSNLYSAFK